MRSLSVLTATLLALLVMVAPGAAPNTIANGPIAMVKDINSTEGSDPTELTAVGDILYFSAFDDDHGRELWRSDGTADGTFLVADIKPGGGWSDPELMMGIDGRLYFTAQDGIHGRELWRTDGTTAGTKLVKNISTGSTNFWKFAALGNKLLFDANAQLWVTDGTALGTRAVGPAAEDMVPFAGRMWFTSGRYSYDQRLWKSDGTVAGTRQVGWSPVEVNELAATADTLFILSGVQTPLQDTPPTLWMTNGTKAGLTRLTVDYQLDQASRLVAAGSRVFFFDENYDPDSTAELWRSNGTVAGTNALSVVPLPEIGLFPSDGRVYFFGTMDGAVWELWKSNGKVAGTKAIDSFAVSPYPEEIAAVANELCFVTEDHNSDTWTLWITDGSVGGAIAVTTQPVAARHPFFMTAAGPRLFFSLDDGVSGGELWSYLP